MFISENLFLLEGTELGYVAAKRVDDVWTISLPPGQTDHPRFVDVETRFASILSDLEANAIPVEIVAVPDTASLQNMACGRLPQARRRALLASIGAA